MASPYAPSGAIADGVLEENGALIGLRRVATQWLDCPAQPEKKGRVQLQ
jgi:hypothetical protein